MLCVNDTCMTSFPTFHFVHSLQEDIFTTSNTLRFRTYCFLYAGLMRWVFVLEKSCYLSNKILNVFKTDDRMIIRIMTRGSVGHAKRKINVHVKASS